MTPRRAAVLGHPIDHSLSPVLHLAAYRALGLDWSYEAVDLVEDTVGGFLSGLDASWAGLSVTAPLKKAVQPHLSETSALARQVGAVNTIVVEQADAGIRLHGHNTDVAGIVAAFAEGDPGAHAGSFGIVGAGGTAAAALAAAGEVSRGPVIVTARRDGAAGDLVAHVPSPAATATPWHHLADVLSSDRVIVTLPGDAAGTLADRIPEHPGALLDVTYHPWPTTFAKAWADRGGTVVGGHRMLLWQAVEQVRLMTGLEPPVEAMATALDHALRTR